MALASTVYMSLLGKNGLRQVSELCYQKAHYAAQQIAKLPDFELWTETPFFHEFVVRCPKPVQEINEELLDYGMLGGYDLGRDFPGMDNYMLIAVTEMVSREEIDSLVAALSEVSNE